MEKQSLTNEKELLLPISQDCEKSFEQIYHRIAPIIRRTIL